jgi:hypothetical protein
VSRLNRDSSSRSHRIRAVIYLALGFIHLFALVFANPASALFGADADAAFTYEAVGVTAENGTLSFDPALPDDGLEGVDCLGTYSRLCGLEVRQLDGNVTVRKVNPVERRATPYVEFFDQYYRRVHDQHGSTTTYGLHPVPAQVVLEDIARPVSETNQSTSISRVLSRGTATVPHRLQHPTQVVLSGDSYYVFNLQRAETPRDGPGQSIVPLATGGLLLAGLWSLRRGWVQYDQWQARQ